MKIKKFYLIVTIIFAIAIGFLLYANYTKEKRIKKAVNYSYSELEKKITETLPEAEKNIEDIENIKNEYEGLLNYIKEKPASKEINGKIISKNGNQITIGCDEKDSRTFNIVNIPENAEIYDYTTSEKITADEISENDYIYVENLSLSKNTSGTVVVNIKNKDLEEMATKTLEGKDKIEGAICNNNKNESYIVVSEYIGETKTIGNIGVSPKYYIKLKYENKDYIIINSEDKVNFAENDNFKALVFTLSEKITDINKMYNIKSVTEGFND